MLNRPVHALDIGSIMAGKVVILIGIIRSPLGLMVVSCISKSTAYLVWSAILHQMRLKFAPTTMTMVGYYHDFVSLQVF